MNVAILIALIGTAVAVPAPPVIKFNLNSEWTMVPDSESRLRMVHISEVNSAPQPFFNPEADVIFTLFTQGGPADGQVITYGDAASLHSTNFNAANPTRLTIHGWNGGPTSNVNIGSTESFHAIGAFNVIAVDWTAAAVTANYIAARNSVDDLGPHVSRFVEFLVSNGASLSNINIIGHSLGGHAAGLGGKFLLNGLVNAVIALDPAGPLFSLDEPQRRVASGDAVYVEVIHTNGNLLGFNDPIGDTDFYPNGGSSQPGCGIDLSGQCAHARAHEFYAESIVSSVGFWADQCTSFDEVTSGTCTTTGNRLAMGGEPANVGGHSGLYFLETASASPFALG